MAIDYVDATTRLKQVVNFGVNLPAQVFREKFTRYFFFDNDICSSEDLISATKAVIIESFGKKSIADVFTTSDIQFLGDLSIRENWITKIALLNTQMNNSGDYGGLIILDQKKQWALFQKTPVDEGVLGINNNGNLDSINNLIYDNFVDCVKIREWLEKKSPNDISLIESMGEDYLINIIENHSTI